MTGLDGRRFRSSTGRATMTVVDLLVTCPWCRRRVDVTPDPAAGVTRFVDHAQVGRAVRRCPGSSRPVTATPTADAVARLLGPA